MLCDECPWRYDYDGAHCLINQPDQPALNDQPPKGERWCSLLEREIPPTGVCDADAPSLRSAVDNQTRVLRLYGQQVAGTMGPYRPIPPAQPNLTLAAIIATKRLLAALRLLHYQQRRGKSEH